MLHAVIRGLVNQNYKSQMSQSTPYIAVITPESRSFHEVSLTQNPVCMKILHLDHDIPTFCVTAESFPHEINKAFGRLIEKLPSEKGRTFFGIAFQSDAGGMIYKAAVQENYPGEARHIGCEVYTIKKGAYIVETVKNWKSDITSIGKTFQKLGDARPDTTFPCVEWYNGADVICMVRIESL
jgi:hypothetical protein